VLFVPGASGAGAFWQPVAERLPAGWSKRLLDLPGLGHLPRDPRVHSFDDLTSLVIDQLEAAPADLIAQSMGGVIAMQAALARPERVRRLVLVATSGGVDLSPFDVSDWRAEYVAEFPDAAPYATAHQPEDLSPRLASVRAPTLLLWAEGDPISPPGVGRYLASRLSNAAPRLVIFNYAEHQFARDHADEVAPLIASHLA
jgi:pimeloyl-ACP methyl ester carboxylesterase